MLSLDLAQAVRKQFTNPHRRQIIIELLGSQFKRSYLSDEPDTPQILVFSRENFILIEPLSWNFKLKYQVASEYDRRAKEKTGE